MNNDPDMAPLYREAYDEIKKEKEWDETEANRIFERYNYLFSEDYKEKTKYSEKYDLSIEKP